MASVIVLTDEIGSTTEAIILLGLVLAYWIIHMAGSVLLFMRVIDWVVCALAHAIPVIPFIYLLIANLWSSARTSMIGAWVVIGFIFVLSLATLIAGWIKLIWLTVRPEKTRYKDTKKVVKKKTTVIEENPSYEKEKRPKEESDDPTYTSHYPMQHKRKHSNSTSIRR